MISGIVPMVSMVPVWRTGRNDLITHDIVKKLRNTAGFGNVVVWGDKTMTVVPIKYPGETHGKKLLC